MTTPCSHVESSSRPWEKERETLKAEAEEAARADKVNENLPEGFFDDKDKDAKVPSSLPLPLTHRLTKGRG